MAFIRSIASVAAVCVFVTASHGQQTALICTSGGVNYQIGDIACIPACHGSERLARCVASNGTASWSTISESCPSAMAPILPLANSLFSESTSRIPLPDSEAGDGIVGSDAPLSEQAPPQFLQQLPLQLSDLPVGRPVSSLALSTSVVVWEI